MKRAILAFLVSVVAVPAVMAQGPNRRPNIDTMVQRQVKRVSDLLPDCTPGQLTALTNLFTQNAKDNQGLMVSMRTARQALSTAEKNNDRDGIQVASTTIGNLTAQMTANRSNFNASLAQILTPDQLKKYKEFAGGGFGGGRRGFGPGGGPGFRGPLA